MVKYDKNDPEFLYMVPLEKLNIFIGELRDFNNSEKGVKKLIDNYKKIVRNLFVSDSPEYENKHDLVVNHNIYKRLSKYFDPDIFLEATKGDIIKVLMGNNIQSFRIEYEQEFHRVILDIDHLGCNSTLDRNWDELIQNIMRTMDNIRDDPIHLEYRMLRSRNVFTFLVPLFVLAVPSLLSAIFNPIINTSTDLLVFLTITIIGLFLLYSSCLLSVYSTAKYVPKWRGCETMIPILHLAGIPNLRDNAKDVVN